MAQARSCCIILLIQLLGRDKCYAVEEPGYSKITAIYESNQVRIQRMRHRQCGPVRSGAAPPGGGQWSTSLPPTTIPPASSCPSAGGRSCCAGRRSSRSGISWRTTTTASSASWAVPSPPCSPSDESQRVIYLNTFSKTIAPSIRISYMILPPRLLELLPGEAGVLRLHRVRLRAVHPGPVFRAGAV